ncbi:Drebrin Developmentally-regulated brain protein [Triplophysa tibetana]|uniref:Drebrin n=1 Tax=Triplophysa tibetana TaxID=1572043 RepID=A0A5A9PHC6_9TELE|nr:Drebrin Developmentally-regulated brain protein [Triplophysa tibetana]
MAVNLSKNRLALLTAYQDVINETSSTDWAVYTYEDDSNDLILSASGDGGLAEIAVTFDITRIMYGFCSIKEPTVTLPRYVLINWVGEDVPDARKCTCASHVATIAEFFQVGLEKGVDVIINASSLDDIDPSHIGMRLTNGTAPVASPVLSRLRMKDEENAENVGTTYQKTNAEIEMKKINREEFWEQARRDEEKRKEEERRKATEEQQRFETERMELEKKEQDEREKKYREREKQIEEHRKKMIEEEEAKEGSRNQPLITEASSDDPSLEKKESEVEEAAAIIAQRPDNPREYFKQRERVQANSVDVSPVAAHRTAVPSPSPGRLDSPFLRQQHSPSDCSPSPSRTPPHKRRQTGSPDDSTEGILERSMTTGCSPIPKISIQEEKDDFFRKEFAFESPKQTPTQESEIIKTPESVPPQVNTDDSLLDLWDSGPAPATTPSQAARIMDLMEDTPEPHLPGSSPSLPQPLMSFDEVPEVPYCNTTEDEPSSLVDVAGPDQMTLSYQQALQHASGSDSQDMDDGQLLLTNGDSLLKEGTQASEGYFSQSQEEDFAQSDDCTAKVNPTPVFYNKPPEIDITCWDTDPVMEDDD